MYIKGCRSDGSVDNRTQIDEALKARRQWKKAFERSFVCANNDLLPSTWYPGTGDLDVFLVSSLE